MWRIGWETVWYAAFTINAQSLMYRATQVPQGATGHTRFVAAAAGRFTHAIGDIGIFEVWGHSQARQPDEIFALAPAWVHSPAYHSRWSTSKLLPGPGPPRRRQFLAAAFNAGADALLITAHSLYTRSLVIAFTKATNNFKCLVASSRILPETTISALVRRHVTVLFRHLRLRRMTKFRMQAK